MILKKMIVNEQEIHVELSMEEAKKAYLNQEPLVFTDENEKQTLIKSLETPKEETKSEEPKQRSRMHKLMQMLPFMDSETIHELLEKILTNDESLHDINIMAVLPFLEKEQATSLFKKAMAGGHPKLNPMAIAPFVDDESLSFIVDEYIAGNITEDQIDGLYPFLSEKDLKRLFKHIINHE
jgi:ATP-dependent exoDNAse (exonuclease V) beta subunit